MVCPSTKTDLGGRYSSNGKVRQSVYLGSQMVYEVEVAKHVLTAEIANPQDHIAFSGGEEVTVTFKEKSLHILPYEEVME